MTAGYPCPNCDSYRAQNPRALALHVQRKHPAELRPIIPVRRELGTETLTPKRVALYLRVSTVDQHPENQLPNLKRHAEMMGLDVAAVYEDKASGKDTQRQALQQMMKDALTRPWEGVMFTRISRLGRSLRHNVEIFDYFQGLGIALLASEEPWDTRTAAGRFARNILACAAEFQREQMIEQVREGIARARLAGTMVGRHPGGCGYAYACPWGVDHRTPYNSHGQPRKHRPKIRGLKDGDPFPPGKVPHPATSRDGMPSEK